MFAEVALDLPLDRTFYYRLPDALSSRAEVGKRVLVPFGPRDSLRTGIVLSLADEVDFPPEKLKEAFDIPDEQPLFTQATLKVCRWVSEHYCSSLGEVLFSFLPSGFCVAESFYIRLRSRVTAKLSRREQEVVEVLKRHSGRLKISALRRKTRIPSFYRVLRSLIAKSVVAREGFVAGEALPKEKFVVFLKDGKVKGRGGEILAYLKEKGRESLKALKGLDFFSYSALRNLVRRGFVGVVEEVVLREGDLGFRDEKKVTLTPSQRKAYEEILKGGAGRFLLSGVSGAGKMEVYLKVALEVVRRGRSVLILVPELLLTPELCSRVEGYFRGHTSLFHGALSRREQASVWLKALTGVPGVFVGTRRAVMLPVRNLGLIVVDEEQDPSYKEQQKPYYHAREVALRRGEVEKVPVVLVSATPSVETYYRATIGEIKHIQLKERVTSVPFPVVKVVDMRTAERVGIFSRELLTALERTVERGEQVLLFINRRGFFSKTFCPECGYTAECPDCAVPLVHHRREKRLICHICGKRYPVLLNCPECGAELEFRGYGTERVEQELRILYPDLKVVRLDQDVVKNHRKALRLIQSIKEGRCDVIVGTQVAVKGHNFPALTLVGILVADLQGGPPDYMTSERIFQSIVHATGRAGRFKPGGAIVQVFRHELPAIKFAVEQRFDEFYREELMARQILNYPPFARAVLLEFQLERAKGFAELEKRFSLVREELRRFFTVSELTPSPIPKVSGRYRFISILRTDSEEKLLSGLSLIRRRFPSIFSKIRYKIEVDPVKLV